MDLPAAVTGELERYFPDVVDALERSHVLCTLSFIQRTPLAFSRDHAALGHVGGSAVVVDEAAGKVLLAHHTVLDEWFFFGNHCEGDGKALPEVALERVRKDAGDAVAAQAVTDGKIFDVDVHYVPAHERKGESVPHHNHYDIAFLFRVSSELKVYETARWFAYDEALRVHGLRGEPDTQFVRTMQKLMRR